MPMAKVPKVFLNPLSHLLIGDFVRFDMDCGALSNLFAQAERPILIFVFIH